MRGFICRKVLTFRLVALDTILIENFRFTGLMNDQHVKKAVLESEVTETVLLNFVRKWPGYYWRAKVTILQNLIFTDLGGGNNLLRNRVILLCRLNRFMLLCI